MTSQIAREETRCRHMGYSFRLAARVLLYASFHKQDNTYHGLCYTSRGSLAGTRNSSMDPPWRIDPTTHRTMSERSYSGATSRYSMVESPLMARWIVGSIPHDEPIELFPILHNWYNKGDCKCYALCRMVNIKDPLLLIENSSPQSGGSWFPYIHQ